MTTLAVEHEGTGAHRPGRRPLPALSAGPVLLVATVLGAVELAMASRYGFHRDELYFIQCGRHLAWGYVDQPPLVPALARAVTAVFGASVFWLRVPSALAAVATVVLTAAIARRLGGGRSAQVLAAVAAATSAQSVATFHLLS
ncbi:MAG: glycosyltransferase family 39 protein, partial [Acidimicrobiales bacterium]